MKTLLFLLLMTVPAVAEVTVTTTDAHPVKGTIVAWSATALSVQSAGQLHAFSTETLLTVRWPESNDSVASDAKFAELIDGTHIPIRRYVASSATATLHTPLSKVPLQVPTAQVRLVHLAAQTAQTAALLTELREKPLAGDVLVVQKTGSERVDSLTGVVEEVTDKQVTFQWDGETVPVKRSKVAAVVYYHAEPSELPKSICELTTHQGARISVANFSFASGQVAITTPCGIKLRLPMGSLRSADFSRGKLLYLSDMQPLSEQWTPRIGLPQAARLIRQHGMPRRDQSFDGSSLSLKWPAEQSGIAGETEFYEKGLALRSRSEIVFRLPKGMRRFVAVAGIDPVTLGQGDVGLEIFIDDRSVWQGDIHGKTVPVELDFPLEGGKKLRIVVDYGRNLDFGDRLHLVQARLIK